VTVAAERRLFTVGEYERMAEAGIFDEDDRLELIEGEVVRMAAIGNRHASCVRRLDHLFSTRLGERALVDTQNPVRLGDLSEPQPDVAVLRPRADFYASGTPTAADVLLLVEVAESSLAYDRHTKVPLYAAKSVSEVWLVDLTAGTVEVFGDPSQAGYRHTRRLGRGDSLAPLAFPDLLLRPDDLLGPAA
jgi:Uma2 family endonuclease